MASKAYQALAANKSISASLRKVFHKLSSDELRHARNIDLFLQSSLQKMEPKERVSSDKINSLKRLAEDFIRKVNVDQLNEGKVLRVAVQMEQELSKIHIQNVLYLNNLPLMNLFETLSAEDQEHIDILNECLNKFTEDNLENP